YAQYRIALRTLYNDWDSVYTFSNQLIDTIALPASGNYKFSAASVDTNGIESLFSREVMLNVIGIDENDLSKGIKLLPNSPNPADEQTLITILSEKSLADK